MTERIEGHGGELALAALRAPAYGRCSRSPAGTSSRSTTRPTQPAFPLSTSATSSRRSSRPRRWPSSTPPRPRRAHRRPRRHQRHLRADQRLLQRRRRCWCSAVGPRSSAGAPAASRRWTTCRWSPRSPSTPRRSSPPTTSRARSVAALTAALTPHRGPVFLDLPLDVIFSAGDAELPEAPPAAPVEPDPEDVAKAAALLAAAQRPVIIAGSDVYAGDAVAALREAAEALQIPVFTNGMGRGALPPSTRSRSPRPAGPRCAAPTWSRSSAPRWTSGSASATSARPRSCTSWTRRASAPPTSRRPSRPPATCG